MILAAEPASSEASSRETGDGPGPGVLSGHCQVARRFGVVRHQQHTPQPAVAASCERRHRKVRAGLRSIRIGKGRAHGVDDHQGRARRLDVRPQPRHRRRTGSRCRGFQGPS